MIIGNVNIRAIARNLVNMCIVHFLAISAKFVHQPHALQLRMIFDTEVPL